MFNSKGILRCARYAFMPNKLDLCGPDKNRDILYYCETQEVDKGLSLILKEFQVLYPYLKFIAYSNQIKDPFDERVIEAYWIGNQLLENIDKSRLYNHLANEQQLKKKLNKKLFKKVTDKISLGAKPHHSFHVLSVLKRTGNVDIMHTLNSMDLCKISWGRIKKVSKTNLEVEYNPLAFENNKLKLDSLINYKVLYQINNSGSIKKPQVNQWISFHWGFACEILNNLQVNNLKKYTLESIQLFNST
ncbi:MAG: hypothetical protein HQ537_01160 [Parcubacteria group bacterium]|nr:hypothetical protein [Parcubacteria group bacterium]